MEQPQYGGEVQRGPRAGFGGRLGAVLIDGIILAIPYAILWVILGDQNLASLFSLVIDLAYFTYFEGGATGQTIGKRAVGIRVVDFNSGGPIGYGRAVGRYFARWLSAIPCLLGYFWMLWDKEKQCWHDKLVTDVVVPVSAYPVS
jgi:uncharacterized RDD family membrane protein YckC